MPPLPDLTRAYRDLLNPESLDLLIEIGKDIFRQTTEVFAKDRQIDKVEPEDLDRVEDLGDLIRLLRRSLRGPRRQSQLSLLARDFKSTVDRRGGDRDYLRRRCNELEPLFLVVRVHRNRQEHQRSMMPVEMQVMCLAGVIGQVVELAYPVFIKENSDAIKALREKSLQASALALGRLPTGPGAARIGRPTSFAAFRRSCARRGRGIARASRSKERPKTHCRRKRLSSRL